MYEYHSSLDHSVIATDLYTTVRYVCENINLWYLKYEKVFIFNIILIVKPQNFE